MVHKRRLQLALALLTAAIVASSGVIYVMRHTLMMSLQSMTHVMSDAQDCVASLQCNKICDGAQSSVAPLAKNLIHRLAILPILALAISLAAIFSLLRLAYLEPVLKRPPKLYLAYKVLLF
jgi:hypothetical protein